MTAYWVKDMALSHAKGAAPLHRPDSSPALTSSCRKVDNRQSAQVLCLLHQVQRSPQLKNHQGITTKEPRHNAEHTMMKNQSQSPRTDRWHTVPREGLLCRRQGPHQQPRSTPECMFCGTVPPNECTVTPHVQHLLFRTPCGTLSLDRKQTPIHVRVAPSPAWHRRRPHLSTSMSSSR